MLKSYILFLEIENVLFSLSWDYSYYILAVTLVLCWVIELSLLMLKKDLSPQVCARSMNWAYRNKIQAVTLFQY